MTIASIMKAINWIYIALAIDIRMIPYVFVTGENLTSKN
jgi:hypothetical protein